jgi:hypothetical protein
MIIVNDFEQSDALESDFANILLVDVGSAMKRYDEDQSQQSRRDMIRTLFAAIEGYTWLYREHVIDTAKTLEDLKVEEEIALSGVGYQVTETGKIVSQPRYLSMLAAFRLTTVIASRLSPDLAIRFDTKDWERLRAAIAIRNRITHPKSQGDLHITEQDLAAAQGAFYWLMDTAMGAMEAANAALRRQSAAFRALLTELREGNPALWRDYIALSGDRGR